MKQSKNIVIVILSVLLAISVSINGVLLVNSNCSNQSAANNSSENLSNNPGTPPGEPPDMNNSSGGGNTNSTADYSGATKYDSSVKKSGGTLNAQNLTVTTQGNSSAAIRSDRGGGTMNIEGGKYTTNGQGSPAIYSTAKVQVKKAQLTATKSEGVVIEGKNSVSLTDTKLTDTNNTLNGNSTTYKNIFIYQSMSGDASQGTGNFVAKNCDIITNKGDTFYITNTQAVIKLTNNRLVNNDGDFMRIEAAKWGNSGSNGGNVTLQLNKQSVKGNIVVDSISTLKMSLTNKSSYTGSINKKNKGKVTLTLSKNSSIKLTGDTYVKKLTDEDKTLSNIDLNGYKMYVNGKLLKK